MSDALYTVIGTVIASGVAGLVAVVVARTNRKATKETAVLPPYEALAARVSDLETEAMRNKKQSAQDARDNAKSIQLLKDQMLELAADRDQLVEYITEWFRWYHAGRVPPPPPVPLHLRDQLVWEEPTDPPPTDGD